METISGISGGGVFVKDENEQIYLVGIEIEYIGIKSLIYVGLKEVIGEINKKLKERFDDEIEVVDNIVKNKSKEPPKSKSKSKQILIFLLIIILGVGGGVVFLSSKKEKRKTFNLKMERFYGTALLNVKFFDNNKCNKPNYITTNLSEGMYQVSIPIERGKSKTIYMKNELINCRPLELNTNDNKMTFQCAIDCNDSKKQDAECAYSNSNPICQIKK